MLYPEIPFIALFIPFFIFAKEGRIRNFKAKLICLPQGIKKIKEYTFCRWDRIVLLIVGFLAGVSKEKQLVYLFSFMSSDEQSWWILSFQYVYFFFFNHFLCLNEILLSAQCTCAFCFLFVVLTNTNDTWKMFKMNNWNKTYLNR